MQSIFHNRKELLLTEFAVTISVEQLKHDVNQMTVEKLTGARLDGTVEVSWKAANKVTGLGISDKLETWSIWNTRKSQSGKNVQVISKMMP